jgi:predicted NBD/HSP70 family sugar kinase
VVGVDLGATSVDVAVATLGAEPVAQYGEPLDVRDGPEPVLRRTSEIIAKLIDEHGIDDALIRGMGIGLPGPVEFSTGRPVSPPIMPGWDRYPVREHFEAGGFDAVYVNVMALGEGWSGLGAQARNYLWIKLGTGIGCGVMNEGRVYRGANGCAGDIGHIAVSGSQVVCRCGQIGCLEAVAGGYGLSRAAETLAQSGDSPSLARSLAEKGALSASDLAVALAEADLGAIELVRTAGAAIGQVLAGLVNFYNPELVIIGGGVAAIGDLLLASIREAVYRRSVPLATRDIVITGSALGGRAGVIGAAAMVLGERYGLVPAGT